MRKGAIHLDNGLVFRGYGSPNPIDCRYRRTVDWTRGISSPGLEDYSNMDLNIMMKGCHTKGHTDECQSLMFIIK